MQWPLRDLRESLTFWAWRIGAPLAVLAAVIGAFRNFSGVPFWDMWPGYVEFYTRIREGNWHEWWALHNEHRIVLARLLFWIDLTVFDGTIVFLIVVNYLLVFASFLTFRAILQDRAGPDAPARPLLVAQMVVLASLFSWMQQENLTWGFQSQFFLAQWLPLLALYLLYRATQPGAASTRDFVLACVTGALCIGTMASGVIALPLMVAYALLLRMGARRVAILAVLTAACLTAYFTDYQSTQGHGSLRDLIRHNPVLLVQYILLYIGGPFYRLTGSESLALGQFAGAVFVVLAAIPAWRCLRAPKQHGLELALLAFILYIGGTALGTGAGRLLFGLQQATASRYTTPAIMAWLALLAVWLPPLLRSLQGGQHRIVWPLLALFVALLARQSDAPNSERPRMFERDVAGLALELGIHDDPQVLQIVFNTPWALHIAKRAAPYNVSVFNRPWLKDVAEQIGQPAGALPAAACRGALTELDDIADDTRWRRITGWIAPAAGGNAIETVRIVDPKGRMVGYALAGERIDGAMPERGGARDTRAFKGYVLAEAAHGTLAAVPRGADCTLRVEGPAAPAFRFLPYAQALPMVQVNLGHIARNDGWTGTDYARSKSPGYTVVGTYGRGDQDTGNVTLRLKRGDALFFRSGPHMKNQTYRVDDGKVFAGRLPRSEPWIALVFDNPGLPAEFSLTLTDAGTGWGEWSAIGLVDKR